MAARSALGEHDLRAFSDLLGRLAAPVPVEEYPNVVVGALPRLVRGRFTGWNEVNMAERRVLGIVEPADRVPSDAEAVFARHMDEHPVLAHYRRTGDGRPYAISDFLAPREYHRLHLYEELFRSMGTEDQVSMVLPAEASLVIGIAINRATRGFSDRDRVVLNLSRPHVLQGYRNAIAFSRAGVMLASLETALEARGEGVIVLDRRQAVEGASARARDLLETWFGSPMPAAALPSPLEDWVTASGRQRGSAPALAFVSQRGDARLVVRLLPAEGRQATSVLLIAEEGPAPVAAALLTLGLTPRESDVLALVARGNTNAEIGRALQLSTRTVQTHLGRIFAKLGVENRTAAARIALEASASQGVVDK